MNIPMFEFLHVLKSVGRNLTFVSASVTIAAVTGAVFGASFTPGNLVVTYENNLLEYTLAGALVQSTSIPYPGGASCTPCEHARDVAVPGFDRAHVYNGTFDPYMSTFNAATGTWSHQTYSGLSTANNVSYGGIANLGRYVFMSDMDTANDIPQGVVRFDLLVAPRYVLRQTLSPLT
jgi:hypothetical protein